MRCKNNANISCQECRLSKLCLPLALSDAEIDQLDDIVQRGKSLPKGQKLYEQGDKFDAIFAVRSGSLKATTIDSDGTEQITGFFFPGEILGLDGIGSNEHTSTLHAIEQSNICKIPFNLLEELSTRLPALQHTLFKVLSTEINRDQQMMALLGSRSASERIASFLLSLSTRQNRRGLSLSDISIPMTRSDIANYLGLTNETASRIMSRFQKQDLISSESRVIKLLNIEQLQFEAKTSH